MYLPSGLIAGDVRVGLPKMSLRGMSLSGSAAGTESASGRRKTATSAAVHARTEFRAFMGDLGERKLAILQRNARIRTKLKSEPYLRIAPSILDISGLEPKQKPDGTLAHTASRRLACNARESGHRAVS